MTFRRPARWLRRHFEGRGIILMYHRVAELASDPWGLAVAPRHFAQQLAVLRTKYFPISLSELVRGLARGAVPKRAVVVTFDDGYADNLEVAKPALQNFDIPATVFIPTGYIGSGSPFWWDDVDRAILQTPELRARLEISIGGATHQWNLSAAQRTRPTDELLRSWRAWRTPPTESRQALFRELYRLLDPLPSDAKDTAVGFLKEWAGISPTAEDYGIVSCEDVRRLATDGLIDIGAHTMSHARLAPLAPQIQRREIQGSRNALEKILGRPVESFAYPHGLPSDYTRDTVTAVREAGFAHACAAYAGAVRCGVDTFELPRCAVPDVEGSAFDAWLSRRRRE